jgi:hypothetical protein
MNNPSQPQERVTLRGSFNVVYFLASSHALCLTPFLHHSFGSEAFGMQGLAALLMILVYGGETRSAAMGNFLLLWLAAFVLQRLRTFSLFQRGERMHSRYGGYPWLAVRLPFVKSEREAIAFEPVLCLAAGTLLGGVSEELGRFVTAGFISLLLKYGIEWQIEQMRLRRMQDAFIEQEHLVGRFHQGQKDY